MTRTEAAELALRSVELEREAVGFCTSLNNPDYCRLMRESIAAKSAVERFIENAKQ